MLKSIILNVSEVLSNKKSLGEFDEKVNLFLIENPNYYVKEFQKIESLNGVFIAVFLLSYKEKEPQTTHKETKKKWQHKKTDTDYDYAKGLNIKANKKKW